MMFKFILSQSGEWERTREQWCQSWYLYPVRFHLILTVHKPDIHIVFAVVCSFFILTRIHTVSLSIYTPRSTMPHSIPSFHVCCLRNAHNLLRASHSFQLNAAQLYHKTVHLKLPYIIYSHVCCVCVCILVNSFQFGSTIAFGGSVFVRQVSMANFIVPHQFRTYVSCMFSFCVARALTRASRTQICTHTHIRL